jgi:hypothetical protein
MFDKILLGGSSRILQTVRKAGRDVLCDICLLSNKWSMPRKKSVLTRLPRLFIDGFLQEKRILYVPVFEDAVSQA